MLSHAVTSTAAVECTAAPTTHGAYAIQLWTQRATISARSVPGTCQHLALAPIDVLLRCCKDMLGHLPPDIASRAILHRRSLPRPTNQSSDIPGDWANLRASVVLVQLAVLLSTILLVYSISTLARACALLAQARKQSYWLSTAQATATVVYSLVTLLAHLELYGWGLGVSCAIMIRSSVTLNNVADAIAGIMLTLKAYYSSGRSRAVLYIGLMLVTLHLPYAAFILLTTTPTISPGHSGCTLDYTLLIVLMKPIICLLGNGFITACFVHVIQQYARHGDTYVFTVLRREGLTYFFLAGMINAVCAMLVIWAPLGPDSVVFYAIDSCLVGRLVVKQLEQARRLGQASPPALSPSFLSRVRQSYTLRAGRPAGGEDDVALTSAAAVSCVDCGLEHGQYGRHVASTHLSFGSGDPYLLQSTTSNTQFTR
ncbi:hypothetical protein THASP1DRAFT_21895 [Thamnocephalis sphaerospora]|uniref:Uncharacterized protein n=1 Tax=Thamnocephalis sphaerospora TaxID=78915 RepID=A0A4P9XVS6_9FUNG|nr:hypothetical protein THASP1DRAFT_21895 [Thamnocephalis sphaerospora]|eukprot:RKP10384.1 hypothetical protein THASP1DRAFT_21895 [Thamnocephalis sphaerospora]